MDEISRLKKQVERAQEKLSEARRELHEAEQAKKRTTPMFTQEHMEKRRGEIVEEVQLWVEKMFKKHPDIQSAMMCVAQYWDDEANDAVHYKVAFSPRDTPDLEKSQYGAEDWNGKEHVYVAGREFYERDYGRDKRVGWDDNNEAIPLFAAFCKEACHQEMELHEAYSPYALFNRQKDGTAKVTIVGKMIRPWLDGVRPEWND